MVRYSYAKLSSVLQYMFEMKHIHLIALTTAILFGCVSKESDQSCSKLKDDIIFSARTMKTLSASAQDVHQFDDLIHRNLSWAQQVQPRLGTCTGLEFARVTTPDNSKFWTESAVMVLLIMELSGHTNEANWRTSQKALGDHLELLLAQPVANGTR